MRFVLAGGGSMLTPTFCVTQAGTLRRRPRLAPAARCRAPLVAAEVGGWARRRSRARETGRGDGVPALDRWDCRRKPRKRRSHFLCARANLPLRRGFVFVSEQHARPAAVASTRGLISFR